MKCRHETPPPAIHLIVSEGYEGLGYVTACGLAVERMNRDIERSGKGIKYEMLDDTEPTTCKSCLKWLERYGDRDY